MSRIRLLHIHVGSGDIPSYLRTGLDLPVLDFDITCSKCSLLAWNHFHRVVVTEPINFPDGWLEIVEIGFHIAEVFDHLPGTVPPVERSAFAVHTLAMSLSPFPEGLSKGMGRNNDDKVGLPLSFNMQPERKGSEFCQSTRGEDLKDTAGHLLIINIDIELIEADIGPEGAD